MIGLTNSGKSSILASLTNAQPEISPFQYTTKKEILGTLDYENIKIQIIDMPAIESENFDQGVANMADTLIIIVTSIQDIEKINSFLKKAQGNKIIVFNKTDLFNEQEKRRIESTLKSKKLNYLLFSAKTHDNLFELKEKIFQSFGKIRIYTKQPHKAFDNAPVIMPQNSTVNDVAEKIFHGLASRVKEARVTGPSSKFPNQRVGLEHELKDKDILEFKTK